MCYIDTGLDGWRINFASNRGTFFAALRTLGFDFRRSFQVIRTFVERG